MNPQLEAALQNPQIRSMLSNPNFIQQMSNPQTMQAILQMQQRGGGGLGAMNPYGGMFGPPPMGFGGANFGSPAPTNTGGLDFSALFNNNPSANNGQTNATRPTAAVPTSAPAPVEDPAVKYANQVQQLQAMGFSDDAANLEALKKTNGNVNAAVERLLGNM